MSSGVDVVEVTVESNLDYAELLQAVAEKITHMMCLDESTAYQVGMSTRESVINAICHGNKLNRAKKVGIRFEIYKDRLVISVDDEGDGFNPATLPDPLAQENLLKPSGRGIFFVKSFMDQVDFLCSPAGGTRLRMMKRVCSNLEGERK